MRTATRLSMNWASLCFVAAVGCSQDTPGSDPRRIALSSQGVQAAVASNARVALKLHSVLSKQSGNLFYSPLSIEAVLGLLYAGSANNTAAQLQSLLDPQSDPAAFHTGLGNLLDDLGGDHPERGYSLDIANQLFGQRGQAWGTEFSAIARDDYRAPMQAEDFTDPELARMHIDSWVDQRTQSHIPELFEMGDISADCVLAVVNALYFKADWATAFSAGGTRDAPFHLASGSDVMVPTMYLNGSSLATGTIASASAIELPYRGGNLSFLALLPATADGLPALEAQLDESALSNGISQLAQDEIDIAMPRFSLRDHIDLVPVLKALGVDDLFDGDADLSKIADGLSVSAFVHEAWVQVNETGTVAAAASGAVASRLAIRQSITFDHPFLFFIRDDLSGAIIFSGRVADPSQTAQP
jgi:serpin B